MPIYWETNLLALHLNKVPDLIDFFVLKGIASNYVSVEECYDLSSGNSPTILTLSVTVIKKSLPPLLTNKWTDWDGFKQGLEQMCIRDSDSTN